MADGGERQPLLGRSGTAPSSPSTRPDSTYSADWRRARQFSPHTPSQRRQSDDVSSIISYTPTKQSFRRWHYFVLSPIVFVLSAGLTAALCAWRRQVKWVELGIGAAAWLAAEALRLPVFYTFTFERMASDGQLIRGSGMVLPTTLHAALQEIVRLGAVALVVKLLPEIETIERRPAPMPREPLPPLDVLFWSALFLALGSALTEIVMQSFDFLTQLLPLYDDVLHDEVDFDEEEEALSLLEANAEEINGKPHVPLTVRTAMEADEDADDEDEDQPDGLLPLDVDAIIRQEERADLEARLGAPLYDIPIGVVLIWRIDSFILSLTLTLLLSLPFRTTDPSLIALPLWPTFGAACFIHVFVSLLWLVRVPNVGIPSVAYSTLVVLVLFLFGVLSMWGVLA